MKTRLAVWVILLSALAVVPLRAGDASAQNRRLGRGVNGIGYDPIWRARDTWVEPIRHALIPATPK